MLHKMKLKAQPFDMIRSGQKTFELRYMMKSGKRFMSVMRLSLVASTAIKRLLWFV